MPVESCAQEIISLVDEINLQLKYKEEFLKKLGQCKTDDDRASLLKGRTKEEYVEYYQKFVLELLDRIDNADKRVIAEFQEPASQNNKELPRTALKGNKTRNSMYLGKRTRKKYLREIGASEDILERITKKKEKKLKEVPEYTVYRTSRYGRFSNILFGRLTRSIISSYPRFYENLSHSLRMADIPILSRTYISCQIMTSLIVCIIFLVSAVTINFLLKSAIPFTIITSIAVAALASISAFGMFYVYPSTVVGSRSRRIKNDLPFLIIHMAAVAGSGARPISIFRLILSSHEYKGVESEIKKIVNYTNLFGYSLTTAMKTVATTTPSKKFRDLLNGLVATVESGGSLKSYLGQMAEESMNSYKIERQKYVETLSTYSDIYTGVLIAAPLLFVVTLAIINIIGGTIGGLTIKTISLIGTFAVIPFLNVAFILFINIIQPEV